MDISKKILSDPVNRWVFSRKNTDTFLVGGYLRDLLRGQDSNDKDFVLGKNAKKTAKDASKIFKGTFIELKQGGVYRVVLKDKTVLDFSCLNLPIVKDLQQRDFTINSMAWSPEKGIIDPFGGKKTLKSNTIKAVRSKNFLNDPLRIIRAYRFAAEIGCKIEKNTKKYLKKYSAELSSVASERITEEFFKILSNYNSVKNIKDMHNDKILSKILNIYSIKENKILSQNIKLLMRFDKIIKPLHNRNKLKKTKGIRKNVVTGTHMEEIRLELFLSDELNQGINRLGAIRLSLLLLNSSISKSKLKVSNNINKAIKDIHNGYRELTSNVRNKESNISSVDLYKIFKASGIRVMEVALIIIFLKEKNLKTILKKVDKFLMLKNKILLNGKDVQDILNIKKGTIIGRILADLEEKRYHGIIKTKAQARKWLLLNYT